MSMLIVITNLDQRTQRSVTFMTVTAPPLVSGALRARDKKYILYLDS